MILGPCFFENDNNELLQYLLPVRLYVMLCRSQDDLKMDRDMVHQRCDALCKHEMGGSPKVTLIIWIIACKVC